MDFSTLSFILALLGLLALIITEFLVDPNSRVLRRVIGVVFITVTIFFCVLGGVLYARDHNIFILPVPGVGGPLGTPTTSLVSLSDDFNDARNGLGYNPNLWFCEGCESYDTRIENGSLRFGIDSDGHSEVISYAALQPDHIQYLEGRLKLSEYEGPDAGEVHLMLHTEISSGWWQTICSMGNESASPGFVCAVEKGAAIVPSIEYITRYMPVKFGEWHTAKIELNPNSFELRFYFDDHLLGAVTPADADELKTKAFTTQFGISSYFESRHIVAYVDDIFLSTIP